MTGELPEITQHFLSDVSRFEPLLLHYGLVIIMAGVAVEGFGILCMASIGPIISVMITGLWARHKVRMQTEAATRVPAETHVQEAEAIL